MNEPGDEYFRAAAYRMSAPQWKDVCTAAAVQAAVMVHSNLLTFSAKGSVKSVFGDLAVGTYLDGDWRRYCARSKRQRAIAVEMGCAGDDDDQDDAGGVNGDLYAYFCSEFVSVCFQEAIMGLFRADREILRILNLDPARCTPMALEGYFKSHATLWQHLGTCSFNFY